MLLLLLHFYVHLWIDTNFFHKTENYITKIIFVAYNGSLRGSWPWLTAFHPPLIIIIRKSLFWPEMCWGSVYFNQDFVWYLGENHSVFFYLCFCFFCFNNWWRIYLLCSFLFIGSKLFSAFFFFFNILFLEGLHTFWQYQLLPSPCMFSILSEDLVIFYSSYNDTIFSSSLAVSDAAFWKNFCLSVHHSFSSTFPRYCCI